MSDDDDLGVDTGQVIAGKYRLNTLLGRGGMGSVWLCEHLHLMSTVALKVIKPDVAKNKNSVARFMREAKAAAMLRSPHVVQILDHGMDGTIAYIGMELLEGESLLRRLKRQKKLTAAETATVMTHVGRAMQKAHEAGIIHRDLKPDNIFLVQNDDEIVGKVLDFGIAKSSVWSLNSTNDSPQTQTGALLGTPYYMSPEQATGQKEVDHRSDLWAMGVIAFECLIGRRPYQSDSLGDLVLQICSRAQPVPSHFGRVPPGFDEWFARAQKREPEDRFQNAKDMVLSLREVLTGSRASAPRTVPRPGPATVGIVTPLAGSPVPASHGQPMSGAVASTTKDPLGQIPAKATPFEQTPHGHMIPGPPRQHLSSNEFYGSGEHHGSGQPYGSGEHRQPYPSGGQYGSGEHAIPSWPSGEAHTMSSVVHPGPPLPAGYGVSVPVHSARDASNYPAPPSSSPGLGLETLDPLAATTAPRRRRVLFGTVLGAMVGLAGAAAGGFFLLRDRERAPIIDAPSAASQTAASATVEVAPEPPPIAEPVEVPPAESAAPTESATPSSEPAEPVAAADEPKPLAVPRPARPAPPNPAPEARPQPPPPPKTKPPTPPPPKPKAQPDDPLGI